MAVRIRPESTPDHDAIRSLTARAFAGLAFSDGIEPHVIDALREADALASSLVAVVGERLVGHIAFSEVGPATLRGWFALGPVSVEPSLQRRGVGTQLIEAGLRGLRARGANDPAEHFQVLPFGPSFRRSESSSTPRSRSEARGPAVRAT